MNSIGLTGGIGSGKSVVAEMFRVLRIQVYNSDKEAKTIMANNSEVKSELISLLGVNSFLDNNINKQFIASKIFSNEHLRNSLNEVVHKYVLEDYINWVNKQTCSKFVILESAILFETGNAKYNKFNITVTSPIELKYSRLKERGLVEEEISNRMKTQWSDEQISKLADYIIINNEKSLVSNQVLSIYKEIISKINS